MLDSLMTWFDSTHIVEQIQAVDIAGLFTNPWFLVPFICLIGYLAFTKAWKAIIIIAIIIGLWWVSGTPYMQTVVQGDQLSIEKILPIAFGGAVVLAVVIYLLIS